MVITVGGGWEGDSMTTGFFFGCWMRFIRSVFYDSKQWCVGILSRNTMGLVAQNEFYDILLHSSSLCNSINGHTWFVYAVCIHRCASNNTTHTHDGRAVTLAFQLTMMWGRGYDKVFFRYRCDNRLMRAQE